MATQQSENLNLTLEDNNEHIGIERTAENFRLIDAFAGLIRTAIEALQSRFPISVANGGTGATTAAQALKNLGINVTAGVINLLSGLKSNVQNQIDSIDNKASGNHTHNKATVSDAGFMSSSDKNKLNNIESGANKTVVDSALSDTSTNPVKNSVLTKKFSELISAISDKQNNLGFTPVQQDGSTKVKIGGADNKLKATVGDKDMGNIVTDGEGNGTLLPMSKVKDLNAEFEKRISEAEKSFGVSKSVIEEILPGGRECFQIDDCTAVIICAGGKTNENVADMALWYVSSSYNEATAIPIVSNSKLNLEVIPGSSVVGSFGTTGAILYIENNSNKVCMAGAIALYGKVY